MGPPDKPLKLSQNNPVIKVTLYEGTCEHNSNPETAHHVPEEIPGRDSTDTGKQPGSVENSKMHI